MAPRRVLVTGAAGQVAAARLLGDRAGLAGAVQDPQIARLPQEGIDRAPLEVGASIDAGSGMGLEVNLVSGIVAI